MILGTMQLGNNYEYKQYKTNSILFKSNIDDINCATYLVLEMKHLISEWFVDLLSSVSGDVLVRWWLFYVILYYFQILLFLLKVFQ